MKEFCQYIKKISQTQNVKLVYALLLLSELFHNSNLCGLDRV